MKKFFRSIAIQITAIILELAFIVYVWSVDVHNVVLRVLLTVGFLILMIPESFALVSEIKRKWK